MDLNNFVLNPAVLLILIFGLVEYIKGLGLQGNALRLLSLLIGVVLAVAFKLRELYPLDRGRLLWPGCRPGGFWCL
jgi:hypothetical protein